MFPSIWSSKRIDRRRIPRDYPVHARTSYMHNIIPSNSQIVQLYNTHRALQCIIYYYYYDDIAGWVGYLYNMPQQSVDSVHAVHKIKNYVIVLRNSRPLLDNRRRYPRNSIPVSGLKARSSFQSTWLQHVYGRTRARRLFYKYIFRIVSAT